MMFHPIGHQFNCDLQLLPVLLKNVPGSGSFGRKKEGILSVGNFIRKLLEKLLRKLIFKNEFY